MWENLKNYKYFVDRHYASYCLNIQWKIFWPEQGLSKDLDYCQYIIYTGCFIIFMPWNTLFHQLTITSEDIKILEFK